MEIALLFELYLWIKIVPFCCGAVVKINAEKKILSLWAACTFAHFVSHLSPFQFLWMGITTKAHKLTFMYSQADFYFPLQWKIEKTMGLLRGFWEKDTKRFSNKKVWNNLFLPRAMLHILCVFSYDIVYKQDFLHCKSILSLFSMRSSIRAPVEKFGILTNFISFR